MTIKRITIVAAMVLLAGVFTVIAIFRGTEKTELPPSTVNDIAQSLAEQWDGISETSLPCLSYHLDYTVLDNSGKFIRATRSGLSENLSDAVRNRDTIVDILRDGKTYGKLIIYNNMNTLWQEYKKRLLSLCIGMILFLFLLLICYAVFLDKTIFRPFRKLKAFASHVAEGNLDIPLEMDRGNMFGAFTESFDLMRDELAKARESERLANESKKELVASLSHDIKTPVASIKAVSEIMAVKTQREEEKKQLGIIDAKADQINALITNLFNATLEELQRLSVTISEQPSTLLNDFIRNVDYNNSAVISSIPDCMILADPQRLSQVIDNIISNSYKYAGTSINVFSLLKGRYLEVGFRDYGCGVLPEELPLLFRKYYRAGNASGKSGAGLGLYISKYLMKKMYGDIFCRNTEDGFIVTIQLQIA